MNRSSQNLWSERGTASIEFAASSVLFMFLAFAVVEYGSIFSQRMAVTQLAREGASLASRQLTTNGNTLAMLASTDGALGLRGNPTKYKIYLAQIDGAISSTSDPQCTLTEVGTLTHGDISAPDTGAKCDLPDNLWAHLEWNTTDDVPGVSQFTVVKVYFQHASLTPVGGLAPMIGGNAHGNTDLLLASQAIF